MLGLAWEHLGGTMDWAQSQGLERDGNGLLLHYTVPKEWIDTQENCINREKMHIWEGAMGIGVLRENAVSAYWWKKNKRKSSREIELRRVW